VDSGVIDSGTVGSDSGVDDPCPSDTFLPVGAAPGPGGAYPAPRLAVSCNATSMIVESNGIPHYTFVAITPADLAAQNLRFELPRHPEVAMRTSAIAREGTVGVAVNGAPFFGPNEGGQPAGQAFGDPIHNGITDGCFGHTAMRGDYHYHALAEKCLDTSGLTAMPWTNADPDGSSASPILGYGLDGFAVYGRFGCADVNCTRVIEFESGWEQIADPTTNAWDAHNYVAKAGEQYLDECNGHVGPNGDYHYHATAAFPYILGCYTGTPSNGMMMGGDGGMMMPPRGDGGMPPRGDGGMPPRGDGGMMPPRDGGTMMAPADGGGMMMGPQSCQMESECTNACPPGSMGCTCANSPMGMICVPTCQNDNDCPSGPMGQLRCETNMGICVP